MEISSFTDKYYFKGYDQIPYICLYYYVIFTLCKTAT